MEEAEFEDAAEKAAEAVWTHQSDEAGGAYAVLCALADPSRTPDADSLLDEILARRAAARSGRGSARP